MRGVPAEVKDLLVRYRRMRAWVRRHRGQRDQTYLRRARLVDEVDERTLRELLRELHAFGQR
jgi:hypothetical protein